MTSDGKVVTTNKNGITILDDDLKTLQDLRNAIDESDAAFDFDYVTVGKRIDPRAC